MFLYLFRVFTVTQLRVEIHQVLEVIVLSLSLLLLAIRSIFEERFFFIFSAQTALLNFLLYKSIKFYVYSKELNLDKSSRLKI